VFTENQTEILRILRLEPATARSMSELGGLLGKHPGVFQRGLNALEQDGYVISERRHGRRQIRINTAHPLYDAVSAILEHHCKPLSADLYVTARLTPQTSSPRVAEAPERYRSAAAKILIIAGPNGAGKTTFAREYLPHEAHCPMFINADFIALGLSPFAPEKAAMQAGRLMLGELRRHIANQQSVAFETTLSGRRYAKRIPAWREQGFGIKLIFLSLPSVELAIARVESRVLQGGHAIPQETIRRRFHAGIENFNAVYKPLVDAWALYDNAGPAPVLIEEDER
jgi:predicted ABC-type ATPase/DNA-binding transcriptional ArsR family regulator